MSESHQRDFASSASSSTIYGTQPQRQNRKICGEFWQSLRTAGLVTEKDVEAKLFDPEAQTLPRRSFFVPWHLSNVGCRTGGRTMHVRHYLQPTDLIQPV